MNWSLLITLKSPLGLLTLCKLATPVTSLMARVFPSLSYNLAVVTTYLFLF